MTKIVIDTTIEENKFYESLSFSEKSKRLETIANYLLERISDMDQESVINLVCELIQDVDYFLDTDEIKIHSAIDEAMYGSWYNYDYEEEQEKTVKAKPISRHPTYDYWTSRKYPVSNSWKAKPSIPDFLSFPKTQVVSDSKVILPSLVVAKIFVLMYNIQDLEWGAYMKLKDIPDNQSLQEKDKVNNIVIEDLVLIPQKRGVGSVEYLENELPEFMTEYVQARMDGYLVQSGRIHSHHSLGAWHSVTDTNEFKEAYKDQNRMVSLVIAHKNKAIYNQVIIEECYKEDYYSKIFDNLTCDTVLFLPYSLNVKQEDRKSSYGAIIRLDTEWHDFTQQDLEKALEWFERFKEMDNFVQKQYYYVEWLNDLVDNKIITQEEEYYCRKLMRENPQLFNVIVSMIDLTDKYYDESQKQTKNSKVIDEIKKLLK